MSNSESPQSRVVWWGLGLASTVLLAVMGGLTSKVYDHQAHIASQGQQLRSMETQLDRIEHKVERVLEGSK